MDQAARAGAGGQAASVNGPGGQGAFEEGTVEANGLRFGYLAAGPEDGPLALCLHGFPDSAYTWRYLLPELAAAGYRAVAPFMRGYAPTGVPEDGAYQTGALSADAVALHAAFGGDGNAVIIGHDWGAFATYGAAASAPGLWRRVVTLALPPLNVMLNAFFDFEQLKRSFYIFLFQTPLAEAALDRAFVEGLWRDWSPGYGPDGRAREVGHVMDCLAYPENVAAAIGYYRAMLDPSRHVDRYAAEQEALTGTGGSPVLYLHGADDGCLGVEGTFPGGDGAAVLEHLPAGSRAEVVQGAGHFLQLERPEEVNARVLAWLAG
ncbi:alpha/beta fold hydrolase [Actinomadura viridis]|uniref:Pimeloyl-ACP methyl ester carboxylesterase n=1 Tax=Actinomadura viridis TaxID=58110 RepID=A0A931DPE6_9ACTN|nr:alpha/beta hydrolase [Actinomadura viridis]MBG6091346.1 pimeloyl-ACP methyl ester carboxylesterase [Actinomadura viridis]